MPLAPDHPLVDQLLPHGRHRRRPHPQGGGDLSGLLRARPESGQGPQVLLLRGGQSVADAEEVGVEMLDGPQRGHDQVIEFVDLNDSSIKLRKLNNVPSTAATSGRGGSFGGSTPRPLLRPQRLVPLHPRRPALELDVAGAVRTVFNDWRGRRGAHSLCARQAACRGW